MQFIRDLPAEPYGLGRIDAPDRKHVERYPFTAPALDFTVEKSLPLPPWHLLHHQGHEGACVGHGVSMMQAIRNLIQCAEQGAINPYIRYNPWWLWDRAKETDEFETTNPGDNNGTTVRAACQILATRGHVNWPNENDKTSIGPENLKSGIKEYKWARTVDEVRAAIAADLPVAIGINWFTNYDVPVFINGEWWIGRDATNLSIDNVGRLRGGHCTCLYGASDTRQAFKQKNSWGADYPEVWMPYDQLDKRLRENAEIVLITDL